MRKTRNYSFIIAIVAIPVIIYFYFLRWRTTAIYGDDLNIFMGHSGLHSLGEKINMDLVYGKFRPVHGLATDLLIELFKKNIVYDYGFNIAIQTINTFIFAALLNLFVRSPWLSLFFALIVGISRFSFFNISQLFNGGCLEGLALTFFLLSLFFIVRALRRSDLTPSEKARGVLLSILLANAAMYTHERYIVIFPFIILTTLVYPGLKVLSTRQRLTLILAALLSMILNIVIKKYIYTMPFLMGTGGTNITFSPSSASSLFADAFLSIIQINSGPDYLIGAAFSSLQVFDQVLVIILVCGMLAVLVFYITGTLKAYVKRKYINPDFLILILLSALFIALLVPAVVTIRLEQRWLQASFCVLVLILAIALNDLTAGKKYVRNSFFIGLGLLLLWTDYNYLYKGADNLYMANCERIAANFKQAIDNGLIRPGTPELYMWEKKRDPNIEREINWVLGEGTFFDFYQDKRKKFLYADSTTSMAGFNADSDQIVYPASRIVEVTKEYLRDSLRDLSDDRIAELVSAVTYQYDQRHILIDSTDFHKFSKRGLYPYESGISWASGKTSIGFMGDFKAVDTLSMVLNTYMPPLCKDVHPVISVMDVKNRSYQPVYSKRVGDKFTFLFHFDQPTPLQKIDIASERINSYPDQRVLSFPFISLEIRNGSSR